MHQALLAKNGDLKILSQYDFQKVKNMTHMNNLINLI